MKMLTTQKQIEIIRDVFDRFVEPVASSFMSGEVPSTMFTIHRKGSREKDWLASVRFRNTLTISVFKCEVFMEDIVNLCRRCKIYLVTDTIYEVVALYFMLHPLYQSQFMIFEHDTIQDYESMMRNAGRSTYRFIKRQFQFEDPVQKTVLEILNCYNLLFTNTVILGRNIREQLENYQSTYVGFMMNRHPGAYKTAIHFKAQNYVVDRDGFIILEPRKDLSKVEYIREEKDLKLPADWEAEDEAKKNKKKNNKLAAILPSRALSTHLKDWVEPEPPTFDLTRRKHGRKRNEHRGEQNEEAKHVEEGTNCTETSEGA